MGRTGTQKPRISEYGKAHAVRFKKRLERELASFCINHQVRVSRVIQAAVECFIRNNDCIPRKKILDEIL